MKNTTDNTEVINVVKELTCNFTKPITREQCNNHQHLKLSGNGTGDRWAKRLFNFTVIYGNRTTRTYSENLDDRVRDEIVNNISDTETNKNRTIVAIFVHGVREVSESSRPIRIDIRNQLKCKKCVNCSLDNNSIIIDHKNDFYNDPRVLSSQTQQLEDFQPLCNACNLQKREVCNREKKMCEIHTGNSIVSVAEFGIKYIPWERKSFDLDDPNCKHNTYWYDPVEYRRLLYIYNLYQAINRQIRKRYSN